MANNNGHQKQISSKSGVGFASQQPLATNSSPQEAHSPDKPQHMPDPQGTSEAKKLDKIRDILFGEQVQTHEQRFAQLEQKLDRECDRLRTEFQEALQQQISKLEDRLRDHVDRLSEQIKTEENDRKAENERIEASISDHEESVNRRLEGLDEKVGETRQELLDELKHQILELKSSMERQIDDVIANLEQEMTSRKTSIEQERSKLSTLFGELSQQLGDTQQLGDNG